jgi:hypothetical protein
MPGSSSVALGSPVVRSAQSNRLGGTKDFSLSLWQKRQAAILYHYASLDYLKGLVTKIDEVLDFLSPTLDTAKAQGRDRLLTNEQWGVRDTSANFSTYGMPFISEFRQTTIKQIAERAFESYGRTDKSYCAGGMREVSMNWVTDDEWSEFERLTEQMFGYAGKIDDTMDRGARWDDSLLTREWEEIGSTLGPLPKFRVRTDVECMTDKKPLRTGVYIPQDDPNGALQFAWSGDDYGELGECSTFNELGLDALNSVGRADLWVNDQKMLDYVLKGRFADVFRKDPDFQSCLTLEGAWAWVSTSAFTERPCKWYFVEMIHGEFDDGTDTNGDQSANIQTNRLRCEAGQPCPQEGYWFTPASPSSRRPFKRGELMPEFTSGYGLTIWQWDENQG